MPRLWLVQDVQSLALFVMKDIWLEKTASTERQIQVSIFVDLERFFTMPRSDADQQLFNAFQDTRKFGISIEELGKAKKYKDYFMTIIADHECDISKELPKDATVERGLFADPLDTPKPHSPTQKNSRCQPSGTPRPLATDKSPVHIQHRASTPRKQYRVVLKEFCSTVGDLGTMGEVASVLEQTTIALRLMLCAGWVHRDISLGNILGFRPTDTDPWQAKLSDLEYARKYLPDPTYQAAIDPKTGTPFFMPHEILDEMFIYNERPSLANALTLLGSDTSVTITNPVPVFNF